MGPLLEPKEVEVLGQDGVAKRFVISKFPAIAGREIITQYPLSAIPKLGDYKTNEALMLRIMSYVEVVREDGTGLRLTTPALVDNHCGDYERLMRLEAEVIGYNCSFFTNGKASTFLDNIVSKAGVFLSKTLTDLSEQSSRKNSPPTVS